MRGSSSACFVARGRNTSRAGRNVFACRARCRLRPAGHLARRERGGRRRAWFLGSVNQSSAARLLDWLRSERPHDRQTLLTAAQLPLEVNLPRPDLVGVDRLLDALAAKRLCRPGQPTIVVDVGTAVTVDLLSPAGAFMGGAILPGMAMSARALHECTEQLPLVDVSQLAAFPPAWADSTLAAIRPGWPGAYWAACGS